MNVLLIEDDPLWRDRLHAHVEVLGFKCDAVRSWNSAFVKLKGPSSYSHIISDLSVGTDSDAGIQALSIMAHQFDAPPTLVVTTHIDFRLMTRCREIRSIVNVIAKPDYFDHLEDIANFLGASTSSVDVLGRIDRNKNRTVFVVHGRDEKFRMSIFAFLRSLGLNPVEWDHAMDLVEGTAPYIGEVIENVLRKCQAVVVLLTPDDQVRLEEHLQAPDEPNVEIEFSGQARPNVLFETGLALGILPNRTVLVSKGNVKLFSDAVGRYIIPFSDTPKFRTALKSRLEKAKCQTDVSGSDWLYIAFPD